MYEADRNELIIDSGAVVVSRLSALCRSFVRVGFGICIVKGLFSPISVMMLDAHIEAIVGFK
jgi:hypothetical protein